MVINQPTMEGPKKPPRLPQPLIRPLAPPATSRGNNIGGMLQNTPLCACWKNPTPTRNAYDTQIISFVWVDMKKQIAKQNIGSAVFTLRFPLRSDRAANTYSPPIVAM